MKESTACDETAKTCAAACRAGVESHMWASLGAPAAPQAQQQQQQQQQFEQQISIDVKQTFERRPSMYDTIQAKRAQIGASQKFHCRNLDPAKAHTNAIDELAASSSHRGAAEEDDDDLTQLQFSSQTFVKEAFYNLAWPLSIPVAAYIEGLNGVKVRSLWPTAYSLGNLLGQLPNAVFAAGLWLPPILYACGLCPSFGVVEVATTHLVTVLHRLCIATKYAYLNPSERSALNDEGASTDAAAVTNEIQLSGWSCQNRSTILLHVKKAEARLFGDLDAIAVRFVSSQQIPPRPLVRMSRIERGVGESGSSAGGPTVLTVALAVLDCCCGRPVDSPDKQGIIAKRSAAIGCLCLCISIAAVPGAIRAASGEAPWGSTAVEAVVYAMIVINQLFFTFVTFLFLYIAYADFSRRSAQLRLMGRMLTHGAGAALHGFRVNLDEPINGCAFIMVIRLLHETGRVFVLRMSAFAMWYMALFAARCIFIVFSFVLPLLYGKPLDAAGVSTTAIEVLSTVGFFTLITSAVGACNAEHHRIEETLLLARLELSTRAKDDPTLETSADTIERMLAVLAHLRTHSPCEFCGVQSSGEFLKVIAGMVAGCGGLLAAWLLSTSSTPVVSVVQATGGEMGNWSSILSG